MNVGPIAEAASAPPRPSCMVCSDVVAGDESYFGMALHRACLDAAEARRRAQYGTEELGRTCQECGWPVGVRDYPAVYPWDSRCKCAPQPGGSLMVEECPVCGQRHELRICPVNENSLLYRPRPAPRKQPAKAKPNAARTARDRIAEPHAR